MAYRFKRREPVPEAFLRIGDEQFAALAIHLRETSDAALHEARMCCKMLRALLKLVAPREARDFGRADIALGKIARALAPVRDAEVRRLTLQAIVAKAGPRATVQFGQVAAVLESQAKSARCLTLTPGDRRDITAMAAAAHRNVRVLPIARRNWGAICLGLAKTYRQGRKAFVAAQDDPSPEARHHWRRHVKHLGYHIRLLHGAHPTKFAALARKLRTLAEILGVEHDLALLRQHIAIHGRRSRARVEFDALATLIDRHRTDLRRTADRLGRRLYKAKPAEFILRAERVWQRWRG